MDEPTGSPHWGIRNWKFLLSWLMYILHQKSNFYWIHTYTVLLGFSPVYNLRRWFQHCWLSCLIYYLLPGTVSYETKLPGASTTGSRHFSKIAYISRTKVFVPPLKERGQERKAKLYQVLSYLWSQGVVMLHLPPFLGKHILVGVGREFCSLKSFLCDVQKGPTLGILEMKGTELE